MLAGPRRSLASRQPVEVSEPPPAELYSSRDMASNNRRVNRSGACLALIGLLVCFASLSPRAQEGHPLTGTWSGDWGPTAAARTHITMVMAWDGKTLTGTINPGPDATAVDAIFLDVTTWTIRFEASTKDASGAQVQVAAEGRLEDIASPHRTITGTWRQGATTGTLKLTRD